MHKLEVLKRAPGAALGGPHVTASPGMTLSFKLPSSYARRLAATGPTLAHTRPESSENHASGPVDAAKDEDALSWEDQDWEARADHALADSRATGSEEDEGEAEEGGGHATTAPEEWEESAAPELPDDFPRLIVNLTRLERQHFPPATVMEHEQVDTSELVATVKTALRRHFTHMAEALFEQQSCFHCTYGTFRSMLDGLHAAYPSDVFALIDYPTEIDGIALSEYMAVLSRASPWKSVAYLQDCLRRCSRDMKWKMDVALELELLAEREHERFTAERQQLSDEIDDLTRLRDSFQAKLSNLQKDGAPGAHGRSVMLLRKLEDIENRLLTLVDAFLEEPELEEHECVGMFGGGDGQRPTAGMNVLDMVIAMVFSRLPRDFTKSTGSEEHFQMLLDHHIHIRRLWKKDFGRLPPRTHAAGMDDVENDVADGEESVRDDGHNAYDDGRDGDDAYEELGEQEEAIELGDALSGSLGVSDGQRRSSSPSKLDDDWEAVNVDEESSAVSARAGDGMDGYGADFDSEESDEGVDSEDEFVAVPSTSAAASPAGSAEQKRPSRRRDAAAPSTDTLVRRHRHRALPGEAPIKKKKKMKKKKSKAASARSTSTEQQQEQEQEQTRRREKEARQAERTLFQPFACTRAVGLLQAAKDNEMF